MNLIDKLTLAVKSKENEQIFKEIMVHEMYLVITDQPCNYTSDYIRNHLFYVNQQNPHQLLSATGLKAVLKDGKLFVAPAMIQEEWDTETILHSASRKETNIIQTEPFLSLSCKLLRVEKDIISNIVLKPESIFQRISNGFTVNPINMIGNSIGNSIDGVIKVVSYAPQVVSYANLKISHSELSIPDCSDPEFVQLIQLLQDPKSLPLCLQIEKYVAQLANVSSPVGNSKMDAISKCLHAFLGDFQNRLESLEWVSKELIADYVDGLESYLIALHYPKIIHRNLQYDTEVDLQFSRRLSALHLFHYKLDSGINIEPIILQKCFALLMEFEQASTVLRKLNVLTIFFTILSDHSKAQNVDGDQFLSLIITVLVETKPPRISSNIEFCSKLRYPKHVHGKHAYCIVTIQAAILFINEIELESIDVPTSLIQFIQPEKSKQLMKKVTHEKQAAATMFSKVLWNNPKPVSKTTSVQEWKKSLHKV